MACSACNVCKGKQLVPDPLTALVCGDVWVNEHNGFKAAVKREQKPPITQPDEVKKLSKGALKTTLEWHIEYSHPGFGKVSERLPADSFEEVFTKSGFDPSENSDFKARKVWVILSRTYIEKLILEGEWIYYTPPPPPPA